ncbi:hypothetical protein HK105_204535 [Polyrhizophydium stewartii]|uniref:Septin-type G domain-containing protein n=1 Tax=Polyrhizophydium stewartii TaxID=2732419 RepID=A0ABR4N8I9_9FUNG
MLPARTVVRSRKHNTHTFNLLVAGHARSGKSSFVATLFETLEVRKLHFPQPPAPAAPASPGAAPGATDSLDRGSVRSVTAPPAGSLLDLQLLALVQHGGEPGVAEKPLPPGRCAVPTPSLAAIECDSPYDPRERLLLNLIDSPGLEVPLALFASPDSPAAEAAAQHAAAQYLAPLLRYIESQFEATLAEESKVRRNPRSPDFMTHACVYMLNPDVIIAAGGLSLVDRLVLAKLCTRVNVVPVLAKSDLLTVRQLRSVRALVAANLHDHAIPVYSFPDDDADADADDEGDEEPPVNLAALVPFRLVNSEVTDDDPDALPFTGLVVNGKKILGREYTWGVVDVENPDHCDFIELKNALFGSHLDDLKHKTRAALYEQWRTERLIDSQSRGPAARLSASKNRASYVTMREE